MAAATLCGILSAPAVAAAAVSPAVTQSTTFAGYVAGVSGTVSTFAGSVSIPTVTCPDTGSMTLQPAVYIHTSGNFLVFVDSVTCSDGAATSSGAFASIYPAAGGSDIAAANLATSPGDVVTMKLKIATTGQATMTISDAKAKTKASATAPVTGSLTSVQAGTNVSGASPTVVPVFSTISFGALKVGSATLTSLSPAEFEIFNGTTLQVSTSKLSKSGSFKNHFVHS